MLNKGDTESAVLRLVIDRRPNKARVGDIFFDTNTLTVRYIDGVSQDGVVVSNRSDDPGNALVIGTDGGIFLGDFVGATETDDGVAGAVPAPSAGDQLRYLRGDGAWVAVGATGAGFVEPILAGGIADGQTVFNLPSEPVNPDTVIMWINGVGYRNLPENFTLSGGTVSWVGAFRLEATDDVFFTYN